MEKYIIKKAGIGKKVSETELPSRVYEDKVFGLAYILSCKPFKEYFLGYPAVILAELSCGIIQPFVVYIPEDAETWAGEITTKSGEKVAKVETTIYL